jgi:hypothetical protein
MSDTTNGLESITTETIDRWYHIFLAFDVYEGKISTSKYFKKILEHRKTKQGDNT